MTVSETIQRSRELQAQVAEARAALRGKRIMLAGRIGRCPECGSVAVGYKCSNNCSQRGM